MNAYLKNIDVSCGIGSINSHTLNQFSESSYFNDMDWDVENGDVSGGQCVVNSHTLYEANNHNPIDYKNKWDGNFSNVSKMEDTGLQDALDIDSM